MSPDDSTEICYEMSLGQCRQRHGVKIRRRFRRRVPLWLQRHSLLYRPAGPRQLGIWRREGLYLLHPEL